MPWRCATPTAPACALGGSLHRLARFGRQRGPRRLFDQLLVAPLDRALPLAEGQDVAVLVAEHLDLHVPSRERLLDAEPAGSPNAAWASAAAAPNASSTSSATWTSRMPLATAPRAGLQQDRDSPSRRLPGARAATEVSHPPSGTDASAMIRRSEILSPSAAITLWWSVCPKTRSSSTHASQRTPGPPQEPVAGMQSLAPGRLGGSDHARDPQVALGCPRPGRRRSPGRPQAARATSPTRRSSTFATASTSSSCSARLTGTVISPRFATRTRLNIRPRLGLAVGISSAPTTAAELDGLGIADVELRDDAVHLGCRLVHQLHCLEDDDRASRRQ